MMTQTDRQTNRRTNTGAKVRHEEFAREKYPDHVSNSTEKGVTVHENSETPKQEKTNMPQIPCASGPMFQVEMENLDGYRITRTDRGSMAHGICAQRSA